jgi:predicted amidohydrolase
VLISETGYEADARLLSTMAKRHQFPVLLSNHLSNTGGWQTAGKNGGWNTFGELAIVAEERVPSLVLVDVSQYGLKATKATFSFRYPTLSNEANLPDSK